MNNFAGRGVMADGSQPTPPEQALESFRVMEGMEIELVASEPAISQPLFVTWDSRGRLWTVQYRQYQFPAGLKILRYDQHLRAVFDRVPEPPPQGVSGKDCITVFEDTNGDGQFDTHHDVINGLNIATSVQVGHGGIWVLNPPYLLFYPDADGDDIPDSQPEVHLSGFGLQDTHSVANSLLWGPDGWLYGANGSTTTGTVSSAVSKGVAFQGQCIWRYHPDSRVFEIYAEGGGNTFSLDIDSKGRVFSGTNGGGTRGFYYPQGSYSSKNWGKHGPLTNSYAFGFFEAMRFVGDDRRFAQAFVIYEGGLLPEKFNGNIIAPNSLHNIVWFSRRFPDGSTYRTEDQQNLCESSDRWFRPVYAGVGPDGAVYLADWYDTRLSHVSPLDDWHKESGRIYRLKPEGSQPRYELGDLRQKTEHQLVDLFSHPNKWVRQRAVLELGWRGERTVADRLESMIDAHQSLEALWALNLLGELTTERARRWLGSASPDIRRWVVRLLGDRGEGVGALIDLATTEPDIQVRSQLAASAKRLPAEFGLPVVAGLLKHEEDLQDPHLPLMVWWALESHAESWNEIEKMLADKSLWNAPMFRKEIAGRLVQRYATTAESENLKRCERLVQLAPDQVSIDELLRGLNRAFQGRTIPPLPAGLAAHLNKYQQELGSSGLVIGLRQGSPTAVDEALKVLTDNSQELGLRTELARCLGEIQSDASLPTLLNLAIGRGSAEPALQRVALVSLRNFSKDSIAGTVIGAMGGSISQEHDLRDTACRTLATRKNWAIALIREVLRWNLRKENIPIDVVQQLRAYADPEVAQLAEQVFGKEILISSAAKLEQMQRLKTLVASQKGDPLAGKIHFTAKCGTCHKLFGEGNTIGPALDAYERGNLSFWLISILEPSAEIREGYQSYAALTEDDRVITGMISAQNGNAVTIRGADNQETTIQQEDLRELRALKTSLMPEDVLQGLSDDQVRDLFAYVMQGTAK
jgi:putative heme-binding domain-containing protein